MKTTLFKLLPTLLLAALTTTPALAIKIVVPEQYEERVEAIKKAEEAERQRQLEGVAAGTTDDSGGLDFSVSDEDPGSNDPAEGSEGEGEANEFLKQSLNEAANTANEFAEEAPENMGFVSGQIVDKESGQPVPGVAILLEGTDVGTITGSDGRYTLGPAPAGQYTLNFVKSGYIPANVAEFDVAAGEVSVFPFALPPRPAEMSDQEYVLTDFTVTADEANQMMINIDLQRMSATQLDIMSAEDFSRIAASDIADAVKSITGVSLSGGKFAVIRGLNDRYSVTQLNGSTLPSPDPDRPAVPLDIFPTGVFDSVNTRKTNTPDMPGEASGGLLDLRLKVFPEERILTFSSSIGINTESQDKWLTADRGGSADYFGRGASGRSFDQSSEIADSVTQVVLDANIGDTINTLIRNHEAETVSVFTPRGKSPDPDFGFSFLYGESFEMKSGSRLGLILAANQKFKTEAQFQDVSTVRPLVASGGQSLVNPGNSGYMVNEFGTKRLIGSQEGQLSVLGGIGYEFSPEFSIQLQSLYVSNSSEEAIIQEPGKAWQSGGGQSQDASFDNSFGDPNLAEVSDSQFAAVEFTQREMLAHQASGKIDLLEKPLGMRWDYGVLLAENEQIEPDTFDTRGRSGFSRFRRETTQDSLVANFDLTLDLGSHFQLFDQGRGTELKFGAYREEGTREYEQREKSTDVRDRLDNFNFASSPPTADLTLSTLERDLGIVGSASGERNIDAVYAMGDIKPSDWLQVVGGVRYEQTELFYDGFGSITQTGTAPFAPELIDARPIDQDDFIPSVNINFDLPKETKLRFAYSRTVARPTFRELQPFPSFNLSTNEAEVGNPGFMAQRPNPNIVNPVLADEFEEFRGLGMAEIHNFDARFEWYPSDGTMYAFGLFYKDVGNPIERIEVRGQQSQIPIFTFINNENNADLYGAEFEFRQNIGTLFGRDEWSFLTLGGNVTFIEAEVRRSEPELVTALVEGDIAREDISENRRLFDQPDLLANLFMTIELEAIGGELNISANHTGQRLTSALGGSGMDIFEDAVTTVNLTYKQDIPWVDGLSVRLSAKNITDPTFRRITEKGESRAPLFDEAGNPISERALESYQKGISYSLSVNYSF